MATSSLSLARCLSHGPKPRRCPLPRRASTRFHGSRATRPRRSRRATRPVRESRGGGRPVGGGAEREGQPRRGQQIPGSMVVHRTSPLRSGLPRWNRRPKGDHARCRRGRRDRNDRNPAAAGSEAAPHRFSGLASGGRERRQQDQRGQPAQRRTRSGHQGRHGRSSILLRPDRPTVGDPPTPPRPGPRRA